MPALIGRLNDGESVSIAAPCLLALAAVALGPTRARAQDVKTIDAKAIIEGMLEARAERYDGVNNYTVFQSLNETGETNLYYERIETEGGPAFRIVPPHEYQGQGLKQAGLANAPGGGGGMPGIGGGMPGDGGEPGGATSDAEGAAGSGRSLLERAGSTALGAATGGLQQQLMQKTMGGMQGMASDLSTSSMQAAAADAKRMRRLLNEMAISGRLEGSEVIDGAECHIVRSDDIDDSGFLDQVGGAPFTLHSVSLCIGPAEQVLRRAVIEGEIAIDGQSRSISMDILSADFRRVQSMYMPFRRVIRISGMKGAMEASDPEKMRQMREDMAEAQAKLKKLDEMLAKMPPAQRRMVEAQMGRARKQMEQFAGASDALETVIEVKEIRVNAGPPSMYGEGSMTASGDVALDIPYMIALASPSSNDAEPPALQIYLGGAIKGPEGDVMVEVSLDLPGDLPSAGVVTGNAGISVHRARGEKARFEAPEGFAHVTITSLDERRIGGEFSFEGVEVRSANPDRAAKIAVRGRFDTLIRGMAAMPSP